MMELGKRKFMISTCCKSFVLICFVSILLKLMEIICHLTCPSWFGKPPYHLSGRLKVWASVLMSAVTKIYLTSGKVKSIRRVQCSHSHIGVRVLSIYSHSCEYLIKIEWLQTWHGDQDGFCPVCVCLLKVKNKSSAPGNQRLSYWFKQAGNRQEQDWS